MSQVSGRKSQAKDKEAGFSFEQLEVYQLAVNVTVKVYRLTQTFPSEGRFGLVHQVRRAATSVALNIAEGKGRNSDKDFLRFLYQARGSILETISGMQIAERLEFISQDTIKSLQPDSKERVENSTTLSPT
jgi:four helix bundle protein